MAFDPTISIGSVIAIITLVLGFGGTILTIATTATRFMAKHETDMVRLEGKLDANRAATESVRDELHELKDRVVGDHEARLRKLEAREKT